jgi:tetratricopeptide (TPR) repeat protein
MTIDLTRALRRVKWKANKRSAASSTRLPEEVLERARNLHALGSYEEAIETILASPHWEDDPQGWRVVGLCALGLKRHSEARKAFEESIRLNTIEIVKDEVNTAAVMLSETAYDEAEQAARRARNLAPQFPSPVVCLLSIYNRTKRYEDIYHLLQDVKTSTPEILADPDFLERVANDTDLIGISKIIGTVSQH